MQTQVIICPPASQSRLSSQPCLPCTHTLPPWHQQTPTPTNTHHHHWHQHTWMHTHMHAHTHAHYPHDTNKHLRTQTHTHHHHHWHQHTWMHTHARTHTHTQTHMHAHYPHDTNIHLRTQTHTHHHHWHQHTWMHTHTRTRSRTRTHTHTHMHKQLTRAHKHTHTHTDTRTLNLIVLLFLLGTHAAEIACTVNLGSHTFSRLACAPNIPTDPFAAQLIRVCAQLKHTWMARLYSLASANRPSFDFCLRYSCSTHTHICWSYICDSYRGHTYVIHVNYKKWLAYTYICESCEL